MAGNSDRGIMLSPVNRAMTGPVPPIGAGSQEGVRALEEHPQRLHPELPISPLLSCKIIPELPWGFNARSRRCHPNAAKIIEPTGKKRGLHYAPSGSGRKEPGTGAYIDAEAPRIENRPERAFGTNGWAEICP